MSGGSKNETSTQQTSVPEWAVPYAQNYMVQGSAVGNSPYQAYTGQRYTDQNAMQQAGINQQANQAYGGSSVNNAASADLTKTIQGGYINQNPYLDQNVQKSNDDIVRNYNLATRPQLDSMDARSGSFGNSGVAQTGQEQNRQLGETLANNTSSMRGADYTNERNRQLQASSLAPGAANASYNDSQQLYNAGTAANQPDQQNKDFQYQQYQEQQADPYKKLTATGAPFGANIGSTVTGTQPGVNKTSQYLGGALTGASALGGLFGNSGSSK